MNYESVMLILMLVKEGIGVAKELQELADRVLKGEKITDEEIKSARKAINDAVNKWDSASIDSASIDPEE